METKKPKVDKAALDASKKAHEAAKNNNEIVKKDGKDRNTGKPQR